MRVQVHKFIFSMFISHYRIKGGLWEAFLRTEFKGVSYSDSHLKPSLPLRLSGKALESSAQIMCTRQEVLPQRMATQSNINSIGEMGRILNGRLLQVQQNHGQPLAPMQ